MTNKEQYVTNYLLSLSERSCRMKNGDYKIGFDWIIYQYGLAQNWQAIRYPFNLEKEGKITSHKTEAEFGIDFCFYDKSNKRIIVFLLKAERLTYNNWTQKDFDYDLRRAITPDLTNIEVDIKKIKKYKIITTYNKNDDKRGIDCYETFIKSAPPKIYGNIDLEYERWNINRFEKEVTENLLTPDVLPNNLSGLFSYISSQVSDFEYGTKEWENQLIPNWNNFLTQIFTKGVDERKINLIPFSLVILKNELKNTKNSIIGWYDLIEYAMLKLWDMFPTLNKTLKKKIFLIWNNLYITELGEYFKNNYELLTTPYGISSKTPYMTLNAISTIYVTYWHIGRLGILYLNALTSINDDSYVKYYANYIEKLIENNPGIYYPLLDINHIELYIIFISYFTNNNKDKLYDFYVKLGNFLCVRITEKTHIPFIESRNRLDLVAEYVATNEKPIEWSAKSSYLITMLLELFTFFEEDKANEIINYYFEEIINCPKNKDTKIDLVSWYPDEDWQNNIFKRQVLKGTGVSTSNFSDFEYKNSRNKQSIIQEFMKELKERDIKISDINRPIATYILACIKYKSPLPPAFWRCIINSHNLYR